MCDSKELQEEEREALLSIYEGDAAFKEINSKTFQYKYGEEDDYRSFLVEIQWNGNYPAELPTINMDTFYNRNIIPAVKSKIQSLLIEEAEQWLGCGMTYTLFEFIKDRLEDITAEQPEPRLHNENELNVGVSAIKIGDDDDATSSKKETKKEQLTKSQKRRQWEQTDHKGERPRGWNWVDIVKHLSQTGHKDDQKSLSNPSAN